MPSKNNINFVFLVICKLNFGSIHVFKVIWQIGMSQNVLLCFTWKKILKNEVQQRHQLSDFGQNLVSDILCQHVTEPEVNALVETCIKI